MPKRESRRLSIGDTTSNTSMRKTQTVFRTGKPGKSRRGRNRNVRRQEWAYRLETAWTAATVWMRETITPGGWFLIATLLLGLVLGLSLGWPEMVAAGGASLALLLLALLFLLGGKTLLAQVRLENDRVVVGTPVTANMNVSNEGARITLPIVVSLPVGPSIVEVPVPFLRSHGTFETSLEIPTERRSIIQVGPPMTTRSSPVGIFVRETTWPGSHVLYVYPETTRLPPTTSGLIRDLEGEPFSRIVNDDLSFHAIREYMPGDQRTHIHWKSTAKTGQLMVRQFEQTVRSEMLVVLSTRLDEYADEDELELAISVAASFGLRGLEDGRQLRFMAGVARPQFAPASLRAVSNIATSGRAPLMDDLSGIEGSDNANHVAEVAEVAAEDSNLASVGVVITGSQVSLEELRRCSLTFGPEIATLAVVCDLHARPGMRPVGDFTVLTVAMLDDLRHLMVRRVQQ